MRIGWFEIRYLIAAPFTLCLLTQYATGYAIWRTLFNRERSVVAYAVMGPWAVLFSLQNYAFNAFVASFIFWEWPREWATSDRLRRYKGTDRYGAERMASALNYFDPGHI